MNFICNFPFFSIVIYLLCGVVCSAVKAKAARIITICAQFAVLVLSVCVLLYTIDAGEPFKYMMGHFPAPWGNELRVGILEGVLAVAFSAVLLFSVIGGDAHCNVDILESKRNLYYIPVNLMGAALCALVYTNDIFTGYVFLEILTLSSCGVLLIRNMGRTTLAATRYMIINLMGSGLFLLGIIMMYDITGHLLLENMHDAVVKLAENQQYSNVLSAATALMCTGLAIKSGLFPFHFWMPDTYGYATATSAALLSGVVSKGYIFLLMKIAIRVIGMDSHAFLGTKRVLLLFGMCAMVVGSVMAMRQKTLDRMIACSSAAQIGYIFVGIGLSTTAGLVASVLHIIVHSITKPLLFLSSAGLSEVSENSSVFGKLSGAAYRNPLAGIMFTLGAFSMIGIPIFGGFTSKLYFSLAAAETLDVFGIAVLIVLAISTLLNAYYFIRTLIRIWGRTKDTLKKRFDPAFAVASIALAGVNMFIGLGAENIANVVRSGINMMN